jgi:phospholipid/cholesterol/gamma-HCH transport system substrate-binding protein
MSGVAMEDRLASVLAEESHRSAKLGRKVAMFLAIAVALVIALAAAALVRHDLFTQTARLYFFADSASGIGKGMSVQLSGFKIGTIDELELESDARVKVRLVINSKYVQFIAQDAEARLAREGLLGVSVVKLIPGTREMRRVANDSVLKFARADDITEKVEPILADIKAITQSLKDPDGDLRQTLKNLRTATERLANTQTAIDQVLLDTRKAVKNVDSVIAGADHALKTAATTTDKASALFDGMNERMPGILLKLDAALASAEAASANAKRITSELANDLPPVLQDARATARDTREITEGAKQAWPIRNWVAPVAESALPLDSHDGVPRP